TLLRMTLLERDLVGRLPQLRRQEMVEEDFRIGIRYRVQNVRHSAWRACDGIKASTTKLVSRTSSGGGTIIPSKVWTPRSSDALPAEGMVQSPRTSRRKSI